MINQEFYTIIDKELGKTVQKFPNDPYLKRHKSKKEDEKKSYALLIWFLEFYGKTSNYTTYITDGDNDSSCDIVFDNYDRYGNQIFYIVQSKWNNAKKVTKETDKGDILKSLSDFETILRGEKTDVNVKLKEKLAELYEHIKNNGEVKFIFLSLCKYRGKADDNIHTFIKKQGGQTSFEVIDIERLKIDYIDRVYKKIDPINPLENYYNPEESPIEIDIMRLNKDGGNHIKIDRPFEAYVFLIRPKAIYDLFDKYGFSLFYKNVRNPLLQSNFNEDIKKTAEDNPAYFWYYNNGITAITYLLPEIREQAEHIKLTGLQIINGAQTVYSLYQAYKNASPTKRKLMDSEAAVTLRLLKSGGKDFDLNVTRYTNSQNPVNDRDFCANDDIQLALQQASYQTNTWYEKRRGEFRHLPEGVRAVSSEVFANVYLAYHLQMPATVVKNHHEQKVIGKNLNFISHKNHKDGMYEEVFNSKTHFNDMLSAFYISDIFRTAFSLANKEQFNNPFYPTLVG